MSKVAIERMQSGLAYGFLGILLVLVLFPFYWMAITSFKNEDQMRSLVSMFWPSPAVLDNPIRTVNLGDHGLHVANARGSIDPEPCGRTPTRCGDALETVVPGEVIDPAGTGRQVGDEVEDALPRGVDGGGDRDGPPAS